MYLLTPGTISSNVPPITTRSQWRWAIIRTPHGLKDANTSTKMSYILPADIHSVSCWKTDASPVLSREVSMTGGTCEKVPDGN